MNSSWGCAARSATWGAFIVLIPVLVALILPPNVTCKTTNKHQTARTPTLAQSQSTTYMSQLVCVSTGSPSTDRRPPTDRSPDATPKRSSRTAPAYRIGTIYRDHHSDRLQSRFDEAVDRENALTAAYPFLNSSLPFEGDMILFLNDIKATLLLICDYIYNQNVTALIVIANSTTINTVSIATLYMGIPLLVYSMDQSGPSAVQGKRPMYLQMNPDPALISSAFTHLLENNNWHDASLITQEDYASDTFAQSLIRLTNHPHWHLEDHIRIPKRATHRAIEHKLLSLLENKSRVIILHCSPELAANIFMVATENGMTGEGYAWFLTEENMVTSQSALQHYPIGIIAISIEGDNVDDVVSDAVAIIASATRSFLRDHAHHDDTINTFSGKRSCLSGNNLKLRFLGDRFFRYLTNVSLPTANGSYYFTEDGKRAQASFKIHNLVQRRSGGKYWKQIGTIRNNAINLSSIVWPGQSISGPIASGTRRLRVVTNLVEPFVMESDAYLGSCTTSIKCLRVDTKDGEMLDEIFKDADRGIYNASRPYQLRCCQGLSIMLLERLARDLDLDVQLYITADERYGDLLNGTWNGMVEDLLHGTAHMAISAFSITKARSRVIDFTHPYFYSSYSILVSERLRSPPIYAFMEPFDSWVWISIAISATVVAVALSLLEWNSPFGLNPWGRKRKTNYTLGSGLNMVYAIFFQHTIKTKSPKAWPSKWLQNFWAGASIFIYSSYTANLAAFLAGKNSGVTITGIHDPKLRHKTVGYLQSSSVDSYLLAARVDVHNLVEVAKTRTGVENVMNGTIDAYLDDTPVLEYARTTMDSNCKLRLVGRGFGEDSFGIGLPTASWLKEPLTRRIMEYHESGFIEDLTDLYFRRSRCKDLALDGQLQGKASSMNFDQHAGLYLLLVVGIFVCILLMFVEHATFKWMVPYWRKKPGKSFWKSLSMMFWSQRLYRIITSEELVSPHHSAREMIQVVKNRDFTKLFQKSVRKQENKARNKKNLFSVVEQLQWKRRREERLSQNPSTQTECSLESDNSPNTPNISVQRSADGPALLHFHQSSHESGGTSSTACSLPPPSRPQRWALNRSTALALPPAKSPGQTALHGPFPSYHVPQVRVKPRLRRQFSRSQSELESSVQSPDTPDYSAAKSDDELLGQSDPDTEPSPGICMRAANIGGYKLVDESDPDHDKGEDEISPDPEEREIRYSNPILSLMGQTSSSEDNLASADAYSLPNGMFFLSPRRDDLARSASRGTNALVNPNKLSNLKNLSRNAPDNLKTIPLKDNRVKSSLQASAVQTRSPSEVRPEPVSNDMEESNLSCLTKEELYLMWKTSEREWNKKLKKALSEKMELEIRLARLLPPENT